MGTTLKNADSASNLTMECLDALLGYHLRLASRAVQSDLALVLAPLKLRMITFTVLAVVDENSGMRQSQFADALNIEPSNMVVIIDELERNGLIRRDKVNSDRRAYALNLTAKGKSLLNVAKQKIIEHELEMFGDLSEEQKGQLREMLIAIRIGKRVKK